MFCVSDGGRNYVEIRKGFTMVQDRLQPATMRSPYCIYHVLCEENETQLRKLFKNNNVISYGYFFREKATYDEYSGLYLVHGTVLKR